MYMSMKIGNYAGINNSYQNSTSGTGAYKSVREYSNYLTNKYSCLTPGKNVAVSITPGLLRKAMNDEKTGQWLERELSKAPNYIEEAQRSASARGDRLLSVSIEFGEEYTTMYTCTVTDTEGTDSNIDKWLERVKESKEELKNAEKLAEKLAQKAIEEPITQQFRGKDLDDVMQQMRRSFQERASDMKLLGLDIQV